MTRFYEYHGEHPAVADACFCRKFWLVAAAVAVLLIAGRHHAHAATLEAADPVGTTIDTRASDGSRVTTTIGPTPRSITVAPDSPAGEVMLCEGAACRSRPVPKGHFACELDRTCGRASGPLIWYRN